MCLINDKNSEQKTTDDVNEDEREREYPLNEFRAPTTETCLPSILPGYPQRLKSAGNEVFNIAPRETKHPVS